MAFMDHFETLSDPRSHINKRHDLHDILFLVVSALLSGAEGWKDIKEFGDVKLDWLRQFRAFEEGIPVDDTIARVISALAPEQFLSCFVSWVNELREADGKDILAIDGKTLRRSHDGQRSSALHMVSVWSCQNGLVLGQSRSVGKKNEIETVMALLELLELKGSTVTLDAMSCQKKIAHKIKAKDADYMISLKGNQGKLHKEVKAYFHKAHRDAPELIQAGQIETTDADHGRIEVRRYHQLALTDWVSEAQQWPGAKSIVEVIRERHVGETKTTETQYYLSSLDVNPEQAAKTIRSHWGVENQVHWVLDVIFKEDDSRIRRENGAENMAMVRRFCMNLARRNKSKNSMRGKLKNAGWNDTFRAELLFG
jgi:predicted transposase YbfD/YdcC